MVIPVPNDVAREKDNYVLTLGLDEIRALPCNSHEMNLPQGRGAPSRRTEQTQQTSPKMPEEGFFPGNPNVVDQGMFQYHCFHAMPNAFRLVLLPKSTTKSFERKVLI